ncbi:MAG: NitT/TauT family transport system substrate-binding protein [Maribacter sp.]|jgi:NitT/TauT family transport system substrate-binding protein
MAGRRLTPLSKLLIVMAIAGGLFFGFTWLKSNGYIGGGDNGGGSNNVTNNGGNENSNNNGNKKDNDKNGGNDDVIDIGVVTWGGYAGGQYWNKGFDANTASNFYKDYGFKVKFHVLDDFDASRDAYRTGNVDLLWSTIDAFPTEAGSLPGEPQVVFQADWSRGGDAIVTRRGIKNVAELKGKKIAVAPLTPSHTFLIWLLDAGNLQPSDVTIIEVPSAIDAAAAFKSKKVDAAVVWSPDDVDCVESVPGSRILQNTKNASHIIADVFFAKKAYIENNKTQLRQLYEGWMKGAAELNKSDAAKQEAAGILAKGLGMPKDFCYDAINNVRLATHGDNINFFGMNPDYKGVTGEDLYSKMKGTYNDLGYDTKSAGNWRSIANKSIVTGVELEGNDHLAEGSKKFTEVKESDKTKEAIASKSVSISFPTGSSTLDENAKYIIDLQFADLAKMFSNARVRVEGNTDNVGNRASNQALSVKRAKSVADYLKQTYSMDSNRFIIVGNGPDKPVVGCESNANATCKAKNRRTDFQLVAD